ncbi:MAG: glycosyltransferase [Mycobacteriales bacterium]
MNPSKRVEDSRGVRELSVDAHRKPDLVLFTYRFPYGEPVLGSELEVTARRFERLFILPSTRGAGAADLPANAVLVDLGWADGWSRSEKLGALRSRLALRILGRTLRHPSNWRAYTAKARTYLDNLATSLLKARSLEGWVEKNDLHSAIFYDYWFENSTLALAVLRDRGVIGCALARAHGFDVFDFRWGDHGRVPFREFKAECLDAIFTVSEDGTRTLRAKLGCDGRKVRLARLGVPLPAAYPQERADPPLVVSCSAMTPLKQVHLIPAVLREYGARLHWVHFGDGPQRREVESAAASLPDSVTWELRGKVDHAEVLDFYATNSVSAFLSLSTSEGVPVSMMEAQSFGVPIVALAVGGVPDIVSAEAGVPLPPGSSIASIAEALAEAIGSGRFDVDRVRSIFAARFDASANYGAFADSLLALWSSGGSLA